MKKIFNTWKENLDPGNALFLVYVLVIFLVIFCGAFAHAQNLSQETTLEENTQKEKFVINEQSSFIM